MIEDQNNIRNMITMPLSVTGLESAHQATRLEGLRELVFETIGAEQFFWNYISLSRHRDVFNGGRNS